MYFDSKIIFDSKFISYVPKYTHTLNCKLFYNKGNKNFLATTQQSKPLEDKSHSLHLPSYSGK